MRVRSASKAAESQSRDGSEQRAMDILQLLGEALEIARQLGFEIREELIGDGRGGACRIRGQKCLFLDFQLGPRERLQKVLDAIRDDAGLTQIALRPAIKHLLARPVAAESTQPR
jgi:hypothetical protein